MSSNVNNPETNLCFTDPLDTPEKMLEHIDNLKRERKDLLLQHRFLLQLLWFVAMHSNDGKGGHMSCQEEKLHESLMNALESHAAELEIEVAELMRSNEILKTVIGIILTRDEQFSSEF